ncbi:Crp/Fnr family transcriptional regulator [Hydrogenophaga sp.]|uniref:Crp/Fnr family transcriptional regulator n=1 Tax=Hydrogenophaga sp. TaxID=1904254 RepID=UPI00286D8E3D|nr:Crp/Fnr family transcriptional regulator [Hydrogenophaga sp.]
MASPSATRSTPSAGEALPDGQTSQAINRTLTQVLQERLSLDERPLRRYGPGQVVIAAGHRVSRLPLIVQGTIDAVMHGSYGKGLQTVPIQFGRGEIVMLSYLFGEQPSTVDMVAIEPTEVRWIGTDELERLVQSEPLLAVLLIRFLSRRLREVQGRERAWMQRSVPLRVAAALVRMASDRDPVQGEWVLKVTHDQIARRAGVSRPKASLAMKQLEREGHISLGRGTVHILDLSALQGKAG